MWAGIMAGVKGKGRQWRIQGRERSIQVRIPTGVNWAGRATVANGACGGEFLRGGIAMGASRISRHELQRASRGIQPGIAKGTNAACERELQRVPRGHVGTNP